MSVTSLPGAPDRRGCRYRPGPLLGELAFHVVEQPCSKISTGSGSASAGHSMPRASSTVAGASTRCRGCARTSLRGCASAGPRAAGRLRSPCGSPAGTPNWPPDMWRQRGGVVDDLVQRQQAEVDRHDLDDRPHAAQRRADAGADERRFRQRRVADSLRPELLEQALGSPRSSRRSGRRPRPSGTRARRAAAPRGWPHARPRDRSSCQRAPSLLRRRLRQSRTA